MFKNILLLSFLFSSLFAYDNKYNYNYGKNSFPNNSKNTVPRGYEKPGDNNYLNMKEDEYIYGKNNSFQGSRPGDKDYNERQMNYLMNGR